MFQNIAYWNAQKYSTLVQLNGGPIAFAGFGGTGSLLIPWNGPVAGIAGWNDTPAQLHDLFVVTLISSEIGVYGSFGGAGAWIEASTSANYVRTFYQVWDGVTATTFSYSEHFLTTGMDILCTYRIRNVDPINPLGTSIGYLETVGTGSQSNPTGTYISGNITTTKSGCLLVAMPSAWDIIKSGPGNHISIAGNSTDPRMLFTPTVVLFQSGTAGGFSVVSGSRQLLTGLPVQGVTGLPGSWGAQYSNTYTPDTDYNFCAVMALHPV